jgi:hypothetical protein
MRRKKFGLYERANNYLQQKYLPERNMRLRCAAAEAEDYHRHAPSAMGLREVFRFERERIIGNNRVVRYDNCFSQVRPQIREYAPAQGQAMVCEWEDGTIEIEYRGSKLPWKKILAAGPRDSARVKLSPQFRVAAHAAP